MRNKKSLMRFIFTGNALASCLEGSADIHYGCYYTAKNIKRDLTRWMKLYGRGKKPRFSTTKKEREELAKKPFKEYGITFKSLNEVKAVAELFKKKFGDKDYSGKKGKFFRDDLRAVVREIRSNEK